jgi:hypothetical protein
VQNRITISISNLREYFRFESAAASVNQVIAKNIHLGASINISPTL